jgi:hypothetical protein
VRLALKGEPPNSPTILCVSRVVVCVCVRVARVIDYTVVRHYLGQPKHGGSSATARG